MVPPRPIVREGAKRRGTVAAARATHAATAAEGAAGRHDGGGQRAARRSRGERSRDGGRGPHNATEAELAEANINRNLRFVPGGGVGGVFQILSKSTLSATFAFNGWQPDRDRKWREVIEVTTPAGTDIERAIVKRMIQLIREHYQGDFRWESRYLGRVVTLSARPEDNDGLEDFLIREFFGTPMRR